MDNRYLVRECVDLGDPGKPLSRDRITVLAVRNPTKHIAQIKRPV